MKAQTAFEEKLNTLSHALGAFLGVVGLIILLLNMILFRLWYSSFVDKILKAPKSII